VKTSAQVIIFVAVLTVDLYVQWREDILTHNSQLQGITRQKQLGMEISSIKPKVMTFKVHVPTKMQNCNG
jgi:hypothetical protein